MKFILGDYMKIVISSMGEPLVGKEWKFVGVNKPIFLLLGGVPSYN